MNVQLVVLGNVDNPTDIAHRVGLAIGVPNATTGAVNVKVIAFSMMVLVLTVSTDCGDLRVNIHARGDVSANVEKEVGTAHLATSAIGAKTTGMKVVSRRATKDVPHSVHSLMEHVLRVMTVTGGTVVSRRATKGVPHSVHSLMERVLHVGNIIMGTHVSFSARTVC